MTTDVVGELAHQVVDELLFGQAVGGVIFEVVGGIFSLTSAVRRMALS